MKPRYRKICNGMVLQARSVCAVSVTAGSLETRPYSQLASKPATEGDSPNTDRLFARIQARAVTKHKNQVAVLHGTDWVLESSIMPSCFPEREVVFSVELGKQFLPYPFIATAKLWITREQDVTHIKIVKSSGSEKRDMVAIGFASSHKCIGRSSAHCSVKGAAVLLRMD